MGDRVAAFIEEHLNDDLHKLLLSAGKYPDIPVPYAVAQIEALRKVKTKIPSWFNPHLQFPAQVSVEQASSEITARFKASLFSGKNMADITGGMGVDSFFWSGSFESVDYVEQNEQLVAAARHNFGVLNAHHIQVHHLTAEQFLQSNKKKYDLIYLDPARRGATNNRLFNLADCQPDIVQLRDQLLSVAPKVLVKTAPLLDITLALKQLEKVTAVWVVAIGDECKEVLYLLENETPASIRQVPVTAVLADKPAYAFTFTKDREEACEEQFSEPLQYLYEPNVAIMKAGGFKSFGQRFGLKKIHPNTHLYTSNEILPDVPGRSFVVRDVVKYDPAHVYRATTSGKANIATRNFPDKVDIVRKRLKISDGGDWYLFAATLHDNSKKIIVCQKTLL